MNKNSNTTKKIAVSAILSALGVIFLSIGSLIEVLDLSASAIAGFVIVVAVIELGGKYPVMIYFAVSVLSILTLPNKFPALFFIFFAGCYPIFKYHFERFHHIVAWIVKFSMFNLFFALMILSVNFLVGRDLLSLSGDDYLVDIFENFKIIIFVVANFVFLLYDIAMTNIINLYIVKIRKIIGFKNYF